MKGENTMYNIDFSNYSNDALVLMKADIDKIITNRKHEEYKIMINKVLDSLKTMAEKFPYEDAITYIGDVEVCCDWEDVYNAFLNECRP